MIQGAGEAAIGIAQLIAMAMEKREGVPYAEGIKKVWMKDSRGLIVKESRSCHFLQLHCTISILLKTP